MKDPIPFKNKKLREIYRKYWFKYNAGWGWFSGVRCLLMRVFKPKYVCLGAGAMTVRRQTSEWIYSLTRAEMELLIRILQNDIKNKRCSLFKQRLK